VDGDRARRVLRALLVLELAGMVLLVLNPSPATASGAVHGLSGYLVSLGAPWWAVSTTLWEYLLNVLLFVPLTFIAALLWPRVPIEGWVIAGFSVSLTLEATQLVVLAGRSSTLSDLSSNTIGAFVGALLATVVSGLARAAARRRAGLEPAAG
jgi:glycopeptide antibiotics resistance protein